MFKSRTHRTLPTPGAGHTLAEAIPSLAKLAGLFLWRLRCRRELSGLTPEQMRDVGLDPEMVRRESRKPFWTA